MTGQSSTAHPDTRSSEPEGLQRGLGLWQVIAVSLGVMGLSLSANLNPQGAEPSAGRAIPLAFIISTIAILLLSHSFVRLAQTLGTSGSVFGFVGATLGPRAGVVAGWCLLGGYLIFGAASGYASAISLLSNFGYTAPNWLAYLITIFMLAIASLFAIFPAKRATDALLIVEGATIVIILIISIVILVRLLSDQGIQGAEFTLAVFIPASGTSPSSLFLGSVFGILAFIGFEGAAAMSSETNNPKRTIPKALVGTVILGGTFYVFTAAVEVMGFGTNPAGLARFHNAGSLFGILGTLYMAPWVGDVVTIGTIFSGVAGAIGCILGASRMIYAKSPRNVGHKSGLRFVWARYGTPVASVATALGVMILSAAVLGFAFHLDVKNVWAWNGKVGTLIVLVAYILGAIGAIRLIWRSTTLRRGEVAIPIAAIAVLGYTAVSNLYPFPSGADAWLPLVAALWVAVSLVLVIAAPERMHNIAADITHETHTSDPDLPKMDQAWRTAIAASPSSPSSSSTAR